MQRSVVNALNECESASRVGEFIADRPVTSLERNVSRIVAGHIA